MQNVPAHYWSKSQVEQLIEQEQNRHKRLFLLLAWRTGARLAEILALEWRDVDLDERTITIRRGKGGKYRIIPIHKDLADALSWVGGDRSPTARIITFSRRTAQRAVLNNAVKAGLRWNTDRRYKPGPHSLRHSAVRHWHLNDVKINQISQWLGHASVDTTLKMYSALMPYDSGSMDTVA